jgi:hypothetical protein
MNSILQQSNLTKTSFCHQQEGPHSALNDDEFYDAVESGLDKIDEEIEFRERLKLSRPPICSKATEHPLWSEVCFLFDNTV